MNDNKAFTLIELIVVMAIIAILVLLAAPSFLNYTKDAKVTAMKQDAKVLSDAAEMYYTDKEKWPVGELVSTHGIGGVDKLYKLDESEIKNSIKNIKNEFSDYGLVIDGVNQGKVFHLEGIEGKDNIIEHGNELAPNKSIYTKEEIDKKVANGYIPISTSSELQEIKNQDMTNNYILTSDIDLIDIDNFIPIGVDSDSFSGTFDGAGFTINNLKIKREKHYSALFGQTNGATIKNVKLLNVHVTGHNRSAAIIGKAINSTIDSVYSSGFIQGHHDTGGVIGTLHDNNVLRNSGSSATVQGTTPHNAGGLSGWNGSGSMIENSYATGDVTGIQSVGGLVGKNREGGIIKNSYATGDVQGDNIVGGLTGYNVSNSSISNSYSTGSVDGKTNVGGLLGANSSTAIATEVYFNIDTSKVKESAKGKGLPTKELKSKATFKNWDSSIWNIEDGKYPTLKWQSK